MKNISGRCQAVYKPLQRQCIHMHNHEGPHACHHGDDTHLWHDSGDDWKEAAGDIIRLPAVGLGASSAG